MNRILILPLSGIGDALMFTPALQLLKSSLPDVEIDALVMFKGVKNFYNNLPQISNVFYYDFLNSKKIPALKFIFKLRNKYDISINIYPSNRIEYSAVNFIIGSKKRLGVEYKLNKIRNFNFLNNERVKENLNTHNVIHNVKLIEKLLGKKFNEIPLLNFPLTDSDLHFADDYITNLNNSRSVKLFGMHAGCSTLKNHINRRWSPENFISLSKKILQDTNNKILLFGGTDETELKEKISLAVNSKNFINVKTSSLKETAALIKKTDLFISNDSGLMHIAAAMKRKIVSLIGPTNPDFIVPWKTEFKIASLNLECAPCFFYSPKPLSCSRSDKQFKCLKDLPVEQVYKIIEQLI